MDLCIRSLCPLAAWSPSLASVYRSSCNPTRVTCRLYITAVLPTGSSELMGEEQLRTPSCLPAATLRPDAQMHLHAAHSAAPRNMLLYAFSKSIPRNSGICSCVSSIACAVALDRATCVCISPAQVLVTLTSSSAASGVPHPICLGSSTSKMSFLNLRRWCELEVRAVYPPELPLRLPVLPGLGFAQPSAPPS